MMYHRTDLAINLFNIITNSEFISFRIGGNCSPRIPAHGNLVGLNEPCLAGLIQDPEGISFSSVNNTDSLLAGVITSESIQRSR